MRTVVIGAGAMGGVYGGLLALAGHPVSLLDTREAHVRAIAREGLRLSGIRGEHTVRLPVATRPAELGRFELAIVFTDSNATAEAAAEAAELLAPEGFALTLQNGIGNVEALEAVLGAGRVLAGVSMNSAAGPAPGCSLFTNAGMTSLGELHGEPSPRAARVVAMLQAAGLEAEVVDDPMAAIWSKFVLNCGVNALTAVSQLRAGEMFRVPELNALQRRVIDEILLVAARKGVRLADPDPRHTIRELCRLRFNKPSMLQHLEQGRRTEIDAINGALVREARALGLDVPCNETLVAVVKGLELSRRQALHGPQPDYEAAEAAALAELRAGLPAPGDEVVS